MSSALAMVAAARLFAPEVAPAPNDTAAPTEAAAPPEASPPTEAPAPAPAEPVAPSEDAPAPEASAPSADATPPADAGSTEAGLEAPAGATDIPPNVLRRLPDSEPSRAVPPPPPPVSHTSSWDDDELAPPTAPVVVRTDSGYALVAIGNPKPIPPIPPEVTIKKWNRSAGVLMGVSAATFMGGAVFQLLRVGAVSGCSDPEICRDDLAAIDVPFGAYTMMFHAMTAAGTGGAGAMMGRARATEDVQIHRRVHNRPGLGILGIALAVGGTIGYVSAGVTLRRYQWIADDPFAAQRMRFLVVDAAALVTAAGTGLAGYSFAYDKHAQALKKIHLGASVSPEFSGLTARGRF
jgi:hypothetical protein